MRLLAVPMLLVLAAAPARAAQAEAGEAPRGWDGFPVFVWRQERAPELLDAPWREPFGATNLGRGEKPDALVERGLAYYVDNAAGRNELHLDRDRAYEARWERWYRTRDDALLVRAPCLNDPAVRARMVATLERTLEGSRGPLRLGVSLGDEISWTPYGSPEDTCLCAECRKAWRAFLEVARAQGRTSLDADFALERASTDAARQALEHKDGVLVHAWLLRREFTQVTVLALLEDLAARARAVEPAPPLGLLGMIGRSAFGGVSLERVLPRLDFAECYRVGDARELLFTLRRPGQRVVQTLFFDPDQPPASVWFAWESWMRGADGFVIWSDRELARRPAFGEGLARTVHRMRELEALAPAFAPRPRGVAIVHDEDSIAYGWLCDARLDGPTWPRRLQGWQESRGSREKSLRALWRVLEDCGAMPGALPLGQVGAQSVERFPLLVLNHLRVLDERGVARLEEYLEAGGRLLVRGGLGEIDARGRFAEKSFSERLGKLRPGAVEELGPELDRYLEERIEGGTALRERVGASLALASVPLAPWRVACSVRMPWLSVWCEEPDGGLLCASLPNLAEPKERDALVKDGGVRHARLFRTQARVEPVEGYGLEWLHPIGAEGNACTLEPGEAAVFRLRRGAPK